MYPGSYEKINTMFLYSTGFTGEPRPSRNQTGCPAIAAGFKSNQEDSIFDFFEIDVFFDVFFRARARAACAFEQARDSNKLASRFEHASRTRASNTRALNTRFD